MQGDFYIGKGKKRAFKKTWRPLRILLILLCLLLFFSLWVHLSLFPQVKAQCSMTISNRLEALANQKAYSLLEGKGYTYTDFIHLVYGEGGSVHAASVDTVKLNLLKMRLASDLLASLHTQNITVISDKRFDEKESCKLTTELRVWCNW